MQQNRVTFVNGEWQGGLEPTSEDPNEALNSCPTVWQYLDEAGRDGWELVSTLNQEMGETQMQTLFLKRQRD